MITDFSSPAYGAFEITAADSDLANETRALFVGGAGNLKVTMVNGDVVTLTGVIGGSVLSLRVKRVWAATTCTNIVGLY